MVYYTNIQQRRGASHLAGIRNSYAQPLPAHEQRRTAVLTQIRSKPLNYYCHYTFKTTIKKLQRRSCFSEMN